MPTEEMTLPLPTLEQEPKATTQADLSLTDLLVKRLEGAGISISDHARNELADEISNSRVKNLNEMGAAYLAISLFASDLVSLIRTMAGAAVPHPHGKEPRMLVFAHEFEAVVKAAPSPFVLPALSEAERLNKEIRTLQRSLKEADSARACLVRVATDLSVALSEPDLTRMLTVAAAAEAARDLVNTELKTLSSIGSSYPTESELASCFYPVTATDTAAIMDGDTLFEPISKNVLYQHGNPRETVTKEAGAAHVLAQLSKGGTVLLRPLGAQGVLALKVRLTTMRLKSLSEVETALGKRGDGVHVGRGQAFNMARELLTTPSWGMPALPAKAAKTVVSGNETQASS